MLSILVNIIIFFKCPLEHNSSGRGDAMFTIVDPAHQSKMPNYVTASGSNGILDQLSHLRAQGIYHNGGVPDSAMEQS